MRHIEMWTGLAMAFASLLIFTWIIPNYVEPSGFTQVSPALLPNVATVLIGGLGLLLFLTRMFGRDLHTDPLPFTLSELAHIAGITAIFSLGAILILNVGFLPGGAALIASLMLYMKERNLLWIGLVSLITPALLYGFFELVLSVNLP